MKISTVEIHCAGQVVQEIDAILVTPYLAVHEGLSENWTITHVPSGHRVFGTPSVWSAIRCAQALSEIDPWDFTDPATVKGWPPEKIQLVADARSKAVAP